MKRELEILSILKSQFHNEMPYGGIEVKEIIDNMMELLKENHSLESIKTNFTGI